MAPSFGTSGLRGLVCELTPDLIATYVRAFLQTCPHGGTVFVGQDLRASSPEIAAQVRAAATAQGVDAVDCGPLPTPALAMAARAAGASAIMVTGSHIPADRNGLKFYLPQGEITKADEAKIVAAYGQTAPQAGRIGQASINTAASAAYSTRYRDAFGPEALAGRRIGLYRHSSVARDLLATLLADLGAEVVPLGQSEVFVPVDTEAVDGDTRQMLKTWCLTRHLDAMVSTDGDADRPILTDAEGAIIPGDLLGVLTARLLRAEVICTPISSNDLVRRMPEFRAVHLTRIGSPHVIAAMEAVLVQQPAARVVGFEPNGGFLLGFAADLGAAPLAPLMTRDAVLPILAPLVAAQRAGKTLAELVAALPACFTAADRLQEIDRDKATAFLDRLTRDEAARSAWFADTGRIASVDLTDGLRLNFTSGEVLHLRPSGNAPEFRVYAQAATPARATKLVAATMHRLPAAVMP